MQPNNADTPLFPVEIRNKYGFINQEGEVVVPPVYDDAASFVSGLARVKLNGLTGFINLRGELQIETRFTDVDDFYDELSKVIQDGSISFIDKTGKQVFDCAHSKTFRFSEGKAAFLQGDRWGFMDKTGKTIIEPQWLEVEWFREGMALVKNCGTHGYIDHSGDTVLSGDHFVQLQSFFEGFARVAVDVKDLQPVRHLGGFINRRTLEKTDVNVRYSYIDKQGGLIREPDLLTASYHFSNGLAIACNKGYDNGYINTSGNFAIAPKFEKAWSFSDGLAAVTIRMKRGRLQLAYIDHTGEPVIMPDSFPQAINHFENGLLRFNNTYLNRKGEVIWPKTRKKTPAIKFEGFRFSRNGVILIDEGITQKAFNDEISEAHLNEEHGTAICYSDGDASYEAILVPYSTDWFGHIIEEVAEYNEKLFVKGTVADKPAKWRSMIKNACMKNKIIWLFDEDENDGEDATPYFMMISVKLYGELHRP